MRTPRSGNSEIVASQLVSKSVNSFGYRSCVFLEMYVRFYGLWDEQRAFGLLRYCKAVCKYDAIQSLFSR